MLNSRQIAEVGVVASLYIVLTIIFAPISYHIFQFRIAELMKGFTLQKRIHAISIGLGILGANLFSPFGVLELTAMPMCGFLSGIISYYVGKKSNKLLGAIVYAILTAFAVSLMLLLYVPNTSLYFLFIAILIPEIILIIGGTVLIGKVLKNDGISRSR